MQDVHLLTQRLENKASKPTEKCILFIALIYYHTPQTFSNITNTQPGTIIIGIKPLFINKNLQCIYPRTLLSQTNRFDSFSSKIIKIIKIYIGWCHRSQKELIQKKYITEAPERNLINQCKQRFDNDLRNNKIIYESQKHVSFYFSLH